MENSPGWGFFGLANVDKRGILLQSVGIMVFLSFPIEVARVHSVLWPICVLLFGQFQSVVIIRVSPFTGFSRQMHFLLNDFDRVLISSSFVHRIGIMIEEVVSGGSE